MKGKLTVGELIEVLKTQPKDSYVALSTDSEGNSFSIIMDTRFIVTDAYMEDELGSQYEYYTKEEVSKAKRTKNKQIKSLWMREPIKVEDLHKVIVLFGSN